MGMKEYIRLFWNTEIILNIRVGTTVTRNNWLTKVKYEEVGQNCRWSIQTNRGFDLSSKLRRYLKKHQPRLAPWWSSAVPYILRHPHIRRKRFMKRLRLNHRKTPLMPELLEQSCCRSHHDPVAAFFGSVLPRSTHHFSPLSQVFCLSA